jgi:hypothetical protein
MSTVGTARPQLPPQVALALCLIGADFILAIVRTFLDPHFSGVQLLVVIPISMTLFSLWLFGLYRRLNWLRWLTVASAVLGLLSLPWAWGSIASHGSVPFQLVKYALFGTGALLLCLPQANSWYGRKAAA